MFNIYLLKENFMKHLINLFFSRKTKIGVTFNADKAIKGWGGFTKDHNAYRGSTY